MTKKKTTAFLRSSGELAGARTALAVTEGVPLVALARCGKYSRGNPANIASNEFCYVVLWRICLHIVINMVWSECLHTYAQTKYIKQRSCATKLRCDDKKRRPHFCSRLVNSLGLEPRTPTLKVLCSTCGATNSSRQIVFGGAKIEHFSEMPK